MRQAPTVEDYVAGVRAGHRPTLARAITLIESEQPAHGEKAQAVLAGLMPHAGRAWRVGLSGVPGVGKSTLIEALGTRLTAKGHKVAVLAVDPSSALTGGSILGDKTRMGQLSVNPDAYIRPSPAGRTLGGVARKTLETITVCEAAGFDVILVETVGVGQSEVLASEMVDTFAVLMLAGAGDELQGIKRGILELADVIAINKADGDNLNRAKAACGSYRAALRYLHPPGSPWVPPVITVSGQSGDGLDHLWGVITQHRDHLSASGALAEKRSAQQIGWMWRLVEDRLREALRHDPKVSAALPGLKQQVLRGDLAPTVAAEQILAAFGGALSTRPQ